MRPGIGFGQPGRPHGRRQERLPPLTADNPRDVDAPPLDGFQPQTSGVLDHLVQEPQRTPHRHPGRGQRAPPNQQQQHQLQPVFKLSPPSRQHQQPLIQQQQQRPRRRFHDVLIEEEYTVPDADEALRQMAATDESVMANLAQQQQWSGEAEGSLAACLQAKIQELTPGPCDRAVRADVAARLNDIVSRGMAGYSGLYVEPYGSFVSGLYTPGGDLDIAVEGSSPGSFWNSEEAASVPLHMLDKEEKARLLKALGSKLNKGQMSKGSIQRILHARVPILKFVDRKTGLPCDVGVGSSGARFKSRVLGLLDAADRRFGQLLRLVKAWARAHSFNAPAEGTFNTFALCLMVAFHLQTLSPPILPPICQLFDKSAHSTEERPLQGGKPHDMGALEVCEARLKAWKPPGSNSSSIPQLFASFLQRFSAAFQMWTCIDDRLSGISAVRASAWGGAWSHGQFLKPYMIGVEDPFDGTDNCARTVSPVNARAICQVLSTSAQVLQSVKSPEDVQKAAAWLFQGVPHPSHPPLSTAVDAPGVAAARAAATLALANGDSASEPGKKARRPKKQGAESALPTAESAERAQQVQGAGQEQASQQQKDSNPSGRVLSLCRRDLSVIDRKAAGAAAPQPPAHPPGGPSFPPGFPPRGVPIEAQRSGSGSRLHHPHQHQHQQLQPQLQLNLPNPPQHPSMNAPVPPFPQPPPSFPPRQLPGSFPPPAFPPPPHSLPPWQQQQLHQPLHPQPLQPPHHFQQQLPHRLDPTHAHGSYAHAQPPRLNHMLPHQQHAHMPAHGSMPHGSHVPHQQPHTPHMPPQHVPPQRQPSQDAAGTQLLRQLLHIGVDPSTRDDTPTHPLARALPESLDLSNVLDSRGSDDGLSTIASAQYGLSQQQQLRQDDLPVSQPRHESWHGQPQYSAPANGKMAGHHQRNNAPQQPASFLHGQQHEHMQPLSSHMQHSHVTEQQSRVQPSVLQSQQMVAPSSAASGEGARQLLAPQDDAGSAGSGRKPRRRQAIRHAGPRAADSQAPQNSTSSPELHVAVNTTGRGAQTVQAGKQQPEAGKAAARRNGHRRPAKATYALSPSS